MLLTFVLIQAQLCKRILCSGKTNTGRRRKKDARTAKKKNTFSTMQGEEKKEMRGI
jgi:hypothetical protein